MKILVLSMDEKNAMGVTSGEGITPELALGMCSAAMQLFNQQLIEVEVQRRLAEAQKEEEGPDNQLLPCQGD